MFEMQESDSERSIRQPYEVGVTILSAIGLVVLIPYNYTLARYWFFAFFFLFFLWYSIGFPPTTKGDYHCIEVKSRYRLRELIEDLSETKFEILALVLSSFRSALDNGPPSSLGHRSGIGRVLLQRDSAGAIKLVGSRQICHCFDFGPFCILSLDARRSI